MAEPNHNWPDSGRWFGAVAGWNMCVSGGSGRGGEGKTQRSLQRRSP